MKKQVLYGLLALTVSFYGCGNDNDPTPSPAPNNPGNAVDCRLTGTGTNGTPAMEIVYDANQRMIRQNLLGSNGQVGDYNEITYTSAGQVDSVKQYMSLFGRIYSKIKATYSPMTGKLTGMEVYNYDMISGTYPLYLKFVYVLDANGKIVLQYGYSGAGEPVSELQFEYANGNQTKAVQYAYVNGVRTYYDTKTMTYDDKRSPYNPWLMPYSHFTYASAHNAKTVQAVLANGSINQQNSYTSTFEYTANNYPSKEVRTYANGTVQNFTFQYACP